MPIQDNNTDVTNSVEAGISDNSQSVYADLGKAAQEEHNIRHGFEVAGYKFLVQKDMFSEVLKGYEVFYVPNVPAAVQGLINHRGNLVPVFNFSALLQDKDNENIRNHYLMVLNSGDKAASFYVNRLPFAINASDEDWNESEKVPNIADSVKKFINQVYEVDDQVLLDFNFERCFLNIASVASAA